MSPYFIKSVLSRGDEVVITIGNANDEAFERQLTLDAWRVFKYLETRDALEAQTAGK